MRHSRLVLPAITLALSAILLVGIGYAITTTVTNSGNSINTDGTTIELYSDQGVSVMMDSAFSNGTLEYYTESENGNMTYKVDSGQVVKLSDQSTYVKSNKTGDLNVSIVGAPSQMFSKFTVTVGEKNVELNGGNGFSAVFSAGDSVDTTTAKLVTITGTTSGYTNSSAPDDMEGISIMFALTPSA